MIDETDKYGMRTYKNVRQHSTLISIFARVTRLSLSLYSE